LGQLPVRQVAALRLVPVVVAVAGPPREEDPLEPIGLVLAADPQLVEQVAFTVSGAEHDDPTADVGDGFDGSPGLVGVWQQTQFVYDDRVHTFTARWVGCARERFEVRLVRKAHTGLVDLHDGATELHPVGQEAAAVLRLLEQLHRVALGLGQHDDGAVGVEERGPEAERRDEGGEPDLAGLEGDGVALSEP
jgi:hypothetical protein